MNTTVLLPLPPTANHCYKHTVINGHQSQAYTDTYKSWREHALYLCHDLKLPDRTPLCVAIRLRLARGVLWRSDCDGYIKPIIDAVVGSRRDQWVTALDVQKRLADTGDEGVEVCVSWEGA